MLPSTTGEPPLLLAPPKWEKLRRAAAPALGAIYEILLQRIAAVDPALRCFVPGEPDRKAIRTQLQTLTAMYPDPEKRPLLFGVPVGVKDIIRVEGRALSCGSLLPPDLFQGTEAACVAALRRAGAVILGRTCTTEFAWAEPGPTANPHDPSRTPGGSSSGSAAAVAAGFCSLSLGTQTIGSVIRPASYCGAIGFKPSLGRLDNRGIVFFSPSVDQVGLLCADLPLLQAALAALLPDWQDAPVPSRIRLGLPVGPYLKQAAPETVSQLRHWLSETADALRNSGKGDLEVIEVACLGDLGEITALHRDLISGEMAREHMDRGWFPRYTPLYRPRTAAMIRSGLRVTSGRMEAGRLSLHSTREALQRLMDTYGLDAWIAPSTIGEADEGLDSTGDPAMNLPWTHAGLPALSLPCGTGPHGLPLGAQLIGRFGDDARLVALAALLDQASLQRQA